MSTKDEGNYQPLSYFQLMEVTLRELLVEKGVITEEQIEREVEDMRARTPERGAQVVARAWVDADFKRKLLQNGTKTCEELGLDLPGLKLVVVENTPRCTTRSSARCARATRACFLASRPTGTSRATTARAWCASRALCSKSSV